MLHLRASVSVVALSCLIAGSLAPTAHATFEITGTECNEGIPTLCLESAGKLFEARGTETYTGKLVPGMEALLEVPGLLHLVCVQDLSKGTISQTEPLIAAVISTKGVLEFSQCSFLEPNGACKVTEPIVVSNLRGTVADEMPIKRGTVKSELESGVFTTLTISGAECLIAGKSSITGQITCDAIEAETDRITHVGLCTHENKGLQFAKKPATLEFQAEVTLESKKPWDVSLG